MGMHGEMEWLANNAPARNGVDSERILLGARSVICVARSYARSRGDEASDPPIAQTIARYARGKDYHAFLRRKVRRLAAFVRTFGTAEAPVRARPLCDEEPILERAWAARAGLGFVGKNGMLIIPGIGSMVLLGEVVTTLDLSPDPPMTERCGSCSRCLDACPTQAFVRPFVLDPRACISYMTIEQKSAVNPEVQAGAYLFGCDDCQLVCPFNATARVPKVRTSDDPFFPLQRWECTRLESLLSLDDEAWNNLAAGSPLRRVTRAHAARSAAIVMANRRDATALPALQRAARDHDNPSVRAAAAWAIDRIAGKE